MQGDFDTHTELEHYISVPLADLLADLTNNEVYNVRYYASLLGREFAVVRRLDKDDIRVDITGLHTRASISDKVCGDVFRRY